MTLEALRRGTEVFFGVVGVNASTAVLGKVLVHVARTEMSMHFTSRDLFNSPGLTMIELYGLVLLVVVVNGG